MLGPIARLGPVEWTLLDPQLGTVAARTRVPPTAGVCSAPSGATQQATQTMPVIKVLQSTIEQSVPDWVEQGRRLGGLLIGVGSQTARPISLASEWAPIAREALTVN